MIGSSITKNIISRNQISWKDGGFFLWNIPGINFPIYNYLNMTHAFEKRYHKEARNIFYHIAEKHSILAIDYIKSRFGIKNPKQILKSVNEQSSVLGYGIFKIIRLNLKNGNAIFKNVNNPVAKYHKVMYGTSKSAVDDYFRGCMAGQMQALTNLKLVCIEKKCIAKGDPYCLFETKQVNQIEDEFRHQIPSNILGPDKIRKLFDKERRITSSPK